MIWTLLFLIGTIVWGTLFIYLYKMWCKASDAWDIRWKDNGKLYKKYKRYDIDGDGEGRFVLTAIMFVVSGIVLIILLISIAVSYYHMDLTIAENEIKYESLQKQVEMLDSDYEDISKATVMQEVTEWNLKVKKQKYKAEDPWTRWFYPRAVVDELKYVEYGGN